MILWNFIQINSFEQRGMSAATVSSLLTTFEDSVQSANGILPKPSDLAPPADGISLLSTKNELFLSYLQHLTFLLILKLDAYADAIKRNRTANSDTDVANVKKLIELRIYLEKGVRPLESKLKYQIDKVLRAAEDDARSTVGRAVVNGKRRPKSDQKALKSDGEGSDSESGSTDSGMSSTAEPAINDLSYRPNLTAFTRPEKSKRPSSPSQSQSGPYRPPHITPTALVPPAPRGTKAGKPRQSATLDEFVADELSTAPQTQPSIGSSILDRGRKITTARERETDKERRQYEETNLVRLPKEGKKEKGRKRRQEYGGEEWRGLGEGVDRIGKLVGKDKGKKRRRF